MAYKKNIHNDYGTDVNVYTNNDSMFQ